MHCELHPTEKSQSWIISCFIPVSCIRNEPHSETERVEVKCEYSWNSICKGISEKTLLQTNRYTTKTQVINVSIQNKLNLSFSITYL